eukprot:jgi/Psemu1/178643/e_gw1.5.42.1
MGTCQSNLERKSGNGDTGSNAFDGVGSMGRDPSHRRCQSIKSTPGGKNNSDVHNFAYDLELVSPSEKTDLTEALSPTSVISPTPFLRRKEEAGDSRLVGGNEDDGFPSDEECEEVSFMDNSNKEICGENNGICDDRNDGSNDYHLNGLSKTTEEEENNEQTMTTRNHRIMRHPNVNEQETETETETETSSGACDHLKTFHVCKPDVPPLLAPPKDVTVVVDTPNNDTSVNPATIAIFNKMKLQATNINKLKKQRRYEEKIEDRRRDIRGYNQLWGEYNEIQERVMKQRESDAKSSTPKSDGNTVHLKDSTSWLVDFYTLNSMNPLDNQGLQSDLRKIYEDDQKGQASLSLLTESTSCPRKNKLHSHVPQQKNAITESFMKHAKDYADISSNIEWKRSQKHRDNHEHNKNKSIIVDLNGSIISDLDNGSITSLISDNERGIDNDDYGVLRRYSRKSVESSVPTFSHSKVFYAQFGEFGDDNLADNQAFFSAETPRKTNSKSNSFPKYLEENCLPSVSIESAETGTIRWRKFPKSEKLNREIDFYGDIQVTEKRNGGQVSHDYGVNINNIENPGNTNLSLSSRRTLQNDSKEELELEKHPSLHPTPSDSSESKTQTGFIQSSYDVPKVADGEAQDINLEDNQLRLVRKVGPQLNGLLAQLKDNGLGEKANY